MITMVEMDGAVPVREQLDDAVAEPVLLVDAFHAPPDEVEALLSAWADDDAFFKAQPGFIWHSSIGASAEAALS